MRAAVLEKCGGLDSPAIKEFAEPEPKSGHAVIQVKAFGINHAEMRMRRSEWADFRQRHRVYGHRQVLSRR